MEQPYDVLILGGGPAGLSGALVLGRCRRRVLVIDDGKPRNGPSRAMHAFLSRDGIPPAEFLRTCREQLARYPTVEFIAAEAVDTGRDGNGFWVLLRDGTRRFGHKLLLATGLVDELPEIPGLRERWGHGVYPCPFCDAWEFQDEPMAVLGCDSAACGFVLEMLTWTNRLTLLVNGGQVDAPDVRRLAQVGIVVDPRRITGLEGPTGQLAEIHFESGEPVRCRALFLLTSQRQRNTFAEKLGCSLLPEDRTVRTDDLQHTHTRGVYAAGNASVGLQAAILAAAEGFKAAYAINDELIEDFLAKTATQWRRMAPLPLDRITTA